jgi:hypothetical protein
VFDPCWLDQARKWSCDDVARAAPSQVPKLCEPPCQICAARDKRDRGFESFFLQRRVSCEPEGDIEDLRYPYLIV